MNRKIIYKQIREVISYENCKRTVLPCLKHQFTLEEFIIQFLLEFNREEKNLINIIGIQGLKWWLQRYYIPRIAKKCKTYHYKDRTLRWSARANYKDSRMIYAVFRHN